VFRDEGVSGAKEAADRPDLTAALEAVERRSAAGVVVFRLDGLARPLTVQEDVLGHVWRHGGRVFAVDTGEVPSDDSSDPMRTFVRQVMGAAHQLERGHIAARMRAGRDLKAERGGYAGFGAPPFGMRGTRPLVSRFRGPSAVPSAVRSSPRSGWALRRLARDAELLESASDSCDHDVDGCIRTLARGIGGPRREQVGEAVELDHGPKQLDHRVNRAAPIG
jgi:hypothetical protein